MTSCKIAICSFFIISCNNENEESSVSDDTPEMIDYKDSIMTIHDRVMPKMSQLENLRKKLTAERKKQISAKNNEQLQKINHLLGELNKSENAMWDWMHNYQPDSLAGNTKMIYLKRELHSVKQMEEIVLSGMAKAQSYFN